ncbi:MAG: hypothetical protein J6U50_02100 [Lachnospiraceae bacterium]|nr:hypothetical protein [Lachnospiraceae bacterium]
MDYRQMPNGQVPDGQTQYQQAPNGQTQYQQIPNTQVPNGQTQYQQAPNGQPQYQQVPNGQMQYQQIPNAQAPNGQVHYGQAQYRQMPNGQSPYAQTQYQQMPNGQVQYSQPQYQQSPYTQASYAQPQSDQSSLSALKLVGLIIALLGLIFRVANNITNYDGITDWWGGMLVGYFILYFTSVLTIVSALLKRNASLVISICMLTISVLFLVFDGILFLGFAITLNSSGMGEIGIVPLVNLLNLVASVLVLIGAARSGR